VGGAPAGVQLIHPVVHLAHRMVRIARAWPVTERHRGRDPGLTGKNLPPILCGEQAEIPKAALEPVTALDLARRRQAPRAIVPGLAATKTIESSGIVKIGQQNGLSRTCGRWTTSAVNRLSPRARRPLIVSVGQLRRWLTVS
jgi:hypothetical protein